MSALHTAVPSPTFHRLTSRSNSARAKVAIKVSAASSAAVRAPAASSMVTREGGQPAGGDGCQRWRCGGGCSNAHAPWLACIALFAMSIYIHRAGGWRGATRQECALPAITVQRGACLPPALIDTLPCKRDEGNCRWLNTGERA